jgi:hypothetical protein
MERIADQPSAHKSPAVSTNNGLSAHILPTSATMVGVCMTVLAISRLVPSGLLRLFEDKLIALDALVFLASAVLSLLSIRAHHGVAQLARLERRAETVFIIGLAMLTLAAVVVAFEIT